MLVLGGFAVIDEVAGDDRDIGQRDGRDCAKVVEFLATDLSDYVTGA